MKKNMGSHAILFKGEPAKKDGANWDAETHSADSIAPKLPPPG